MTAVRVQSCLVMAVYENGASTGISLAAQWLQLHGCTAGAVGSIPGGGTNSLHSQKIDKKKKSMHVFTHMYPWG